MTQKAIAAPPTFYWRVETTKELNHKTDELSARSYF